jgi:multidrug resistance protein, MATE family
MIVPWVRARTIFSLSLPVALVLLGQVLMSLIAIAMVSHLGAAAVAGIGVASALLSMLMAVLFGIDAGVQALVARRIGAGETRAAGGTLNDALAIAVVAGPMLTLLGYVTGPALLELIASDPGVVRQGLRFLDAALPMLLFLGASFAFSAYWNGAGMPRYSLLVTAVQLPCGVLFSYLLIFGARLEMVGAGLGATLAALVGLVGHLLLAWRIAPLPGFLRTRPSWVSARTILKIGLPVSLQQCLVYLGSMVLFGIVGLIGPAEVAAMNVVLTMMMLSILPAAGMGIAAATLVGAALGRGDVADATRWGWQVARLGALGFLVVGLILALAPRDTLGLFIADPATIDLAATPLGVLALGMSVDAFGRILGFAMRGAGATRLVTAVAFALQWGVQLPLAWFVGVHLDFGLPGMAISRLALFVVEAACLTAMWANGFWHRAPSSPHSKSTPQP